MKKLFKAFTLAEVLITLAIVGVVASLTLPALTLNIQQQTAETALAKAINTLESVNEKMKLERSSKRLTTCYGDNAAMVVRPQRYLPALSTYLNGSFKNANVMINGAYSNRPTFTTKDGILFTSDIDDVAVAQASSPKYFANADNFFIIDVNGSKGPNKYGKDQFVVVIDNYGAVIPYGSAQYAEFKGNNNVLWEAGCPSRKDVKPTNAQACSGAIVDNGYKILYGYNAL